MTTTTLKTSILAALLVVAAIKGQGAPDAQIQQAHSSGLTAKITLPDGTVRMAKLEGLGCTASICSRVAIKGNLDGGSLTSFWLDGIAAIRDTTENGALVVMKDGSQHRLSLVTDFRVLYLANRSSRAERLDLAKVKSIEFLAPAR